jgi:hypothetical protein
MTVLMTSVGVQAASAKATSAKKLRAIKIDLRDIIFSSKENLVWIFLLNKLQSCVHNLALFPKNHLLSRG